LNGNDVLKDLRSSETLAHTPIILHSTKTLDEAEMRFFEEHGIALFSKQALTLPDSAVRLRDLMSNLAAHARAEKNAHA
jgi:hypothetical protein